MPRFAGLLAVAAVLLALSSAAGSAGSGKRQIFVSSNADPAAYGQQVVFRAVVLPAPAMGGKVVFLDGTTKLGAGLLGADGTATLATRKLDLGDHTIVAEYAPNQGGPSASMAQTIQPAQTTTKLSASPKGASLGQTVTLTARVAGAGGIIAGGGAIPTGQVTFYADGDPLDTVPLVNGTASVTVTPRAGMHYAWGRYTSGGGGFLDSQSAFVVVQVSAAPQGFWVVNSTGQVFSFGDAVDYGSLQGASSPIVGMASTPDGGGYWLVGSDGSVFAFGDAKEAHSSLAGGTSPIQAIAPTADGNGYWLVSVDGHIFPVGDAVDYGSLAGVQLSAPVVGITATLDGGGYWLATADGGIFPFGDAVYYGSAKGRATRLLGTLTGIPASLDAKGYWQVTSTGEVFAFGDAVGRGSLGGVSLKKPIVGMAVTPDGGGYWLVASDGGIFPFGDAVVSGGGVIVGNVVGATAVSATASR